MNINRVGYNYSESFDLNNNFFKESESIIMVFIRISNYCKDKLLIAEAYFKELYEKKPQTSNIDEIVQIKKTLNQIAITLRNMNFFKKEFAAFNTIKDMINYILDKPIVLNKSLSFIRECLNLFEDMVDNMSNSINTSSVSAKQSYSSNLDIFDEKLFSLEEKFYETYYENTHKYDKLIKDTSRIILG